MATCKTIIILLLFYIKYISNCNGAACETLTIQADCDKAAPRCVWKTGSCYCGSTVPLDVFFVMDESGSMGSNHFDKERNFIADMITKGLSDDSNVAIMKFASQLRGVYWFWMNQTPKTDAINAVLTTPYYGGGTYMSDALWGVRYIYDLWQNDANYNQNYAGYDRLLVFLTDGKPTGGYSPCPEVEATQAVVGAENIIVVGMGKGFSKSAVKCMVTPGYPNSRSADYNRILEVDTWSDEAFAAARQAASKFLCPETMSAKLTEVRMEQYSNGPTNHLSRFIEIYNFGQSVIDLSQETLKFDGFMTSASFGAATTGSSCSLSIDPSQYLVIYDNSADMPECPNCNCTLSAQQCTEAVYIPCDGSLSTNNCGICSWDTNTATASNDIWTQTIMDYAGDGILSTATRASLNDWPKKVFPGYSTELSSSDLSPEDGGNWDMSCRYQGTPGATPIKTCDVSCIVQICSSNGDVNATCHGSDMCACTASNHYILTSNRQTCVLMPPPINCVAENRLDSDLDFVVTEIAWEEGTAYEPGVRYEVYTSYLEAGTAESYATNKLIFPPNADMPASAVITVTAFMENDPVNGKVYSASTTCPITTMAPSPQPTASPTYSNADIDTCTANIRNSGNGYKIDVSWSAGYPKDLHDIPPDAQGNYQYYIFGHYIPGQTSTKIEKITTVLTETLSANALDLPGNPPDINVVTVYYINGVLDTTSSTNCTINTLAPTPSPTNFPTYIPTNDPTKDPTTDPTQRPTYAPWTLTQCSLHIPSDLTLVIAITFTFDRAFDANDRAAFIFSYNNRQEEFLVDDTQSGSALEKTVGIAVVQQADINQLNLAIELNTFRAYIQYNDYPGNTMNSDEVICTFSTEVPTISPTNDPTADPTKAPTRRPSVSPTKAPTDIPTLSPTYQGLRLDYPCTATVSGNGENVRVVFQETIFDDTNVDKIYPPSTSIKYIISVGSQTEIMFAAVSNATQTAPVFSMKGNNVFIPGTQVSIDIDDNLGDTSSVPIFCMIETQVPTKSPTTLPPTAHPTTQQPIVRLNLDDIGSWGIDKGCIFADEDVRRRRMQLIDYECIGCPVCTVTENSDERFIRIERYPADFAFDIHVVIEIEYLTDSNGDVMEEDDIDFSHGKTHNKWKKLFGGGEEVDKYIVGGLDDYTLDISYYLTLEVDDPEEENAEPIEYFVVRIVDCFVDESGGATNVVPDDLRGENMPYVCSPGIYQRVIVAVVQLDEDDTFITQKTGEMPLWVWYPIGFAALAIPFVAYLIWRFYNAKKRADVMEKQRKFELGEAEKQDDVGEFGIIGDHIQANPIATGAAFEVDKGDAIINHQLQIEKMNFETAQVEVEHNIFKQEFGPVQAEKNIMDPQEKFSD